MPVSRALANAAGLLSGRPFRLEQGEYGTKLVVTGAWEEAVAQYLESHAIRELELNHAKGFRCPGDTPEFLAGLTSLESLAIAYPSFTNLDPVNGLSDLRCLLLGFSSKVRGLRLEALVRLEKLGLEWFKGAAGLFELRELRDLALFLFPGKEGSGPFGALGKLEEFRLSSSGLTEVDAFSAMKGMRRLELLNMSHLASLGGIAPLHGMRKLRLETCKRIGAIDAVRDLTELTYLSFSDCNGIASLRPIEKLKKLELLHFHGSTDILDGDLGVLRSLPNLKDVRFQNRRHYNVKREEFPPFGK